MCSVGVSFDRSAFLFDTRRLSCSFSESLWSQWFRPDFHMHILDYVIDRYFNTIKRSLLHNHLLWSADSWQSCTRRSSCHYRDRPVDFVRFDLLPSQDTDHDDGLFWSAATMASYSTFSKFQNKIRYWPQFPIESNISSIINNSSQIYIIN